MNKRKNHHYVPRFYLKRFSINGDGKIIGLYNHISKIYKCNAPIKHQASAAYLYGTDDVIESELEKLETTIAKLFYYWTEEKILVPPPPNSNAYSILKRFILYQLYRTPKSGNDTMRSINEGFQAILPFVKSDIKVEYEKIEIVNKSPVILSLLYSSEYEFLLNFLDCKFIVNLSSISFITSDSPVILYNQYLERFGVYMGATGLPVKGLQIFYPIHPRLMICLFDPKVYDCGKSENCISTEKEDDVNQLNILQCLNSEQQLFFDETISKKYIENIVAEKEDKPPAKNINSILRTPDNRAFLLLSSEGIKIDLDLSFFKIICGVRSLEVSPLRHPSLERSTNKKIDNM